MARRINSGFGFRDIPLALSGYKNRRKSESIDSMAQVFQGSAVMPVEAGTIAASLCRNVASSCSVIVV
jgi:hypothetical protein